MNIKNIILHEVDRKKSSNDSTYIALQLRKKENPADEHSKALVSSLSELFRKTGLSSGHFYTPESEDEDKPKLERLINAYYSAGSFSNFKKFSDAVAVHLKSVLDKSKTGKGGYLWINFYTHGDSNFLSLVILRKKDALQIKDLSLDKVEEIDLEKLHMAARINITHWEEKDPLKDRYIAFKVGKSSSELTSYFQDFIGCSEAFRATRDTNNLIEVTKKYCAAHKFNDTRTETARREVEDICLQWVSDDRPVLLEEISKLLDNIYIESESDRGKFLEIAQSEPYNLTNEIRIDKGALRKLTRYKGSSKFMSISFESELLGKSVLFDSAEGSLKITDLPDDLLNQLRQDEADGS